MDVTKSNFEKAVTAIEAVLPAADFVSVDLEFTGLSTTITNDYLDTYEQVYAKSRANVVQFQIIQIGLSIFKAVKKEVGAAEEEEDRLKRCEEFDCHSFNFYIFPRPCRALERQEKERFFLSQASSLAFLAEHGFDFNRLIAEGVSYLNLAQAKAVKERLRSEEKKGGGGVPGAASTRTDRVTITREEDKEFVAEVMRQIAEFAADSARTELALPLANPFRRRLMYEALADSPFADSIELANISADRMKLTALRSSPELKAERERRDELDMVGFSEVVRLLMKHQKPLVGHNIYLDLLFLYNTFLEPLPESYADFKIFLHSIFPTVYDTRFLSAHNIIGALVGANSLGNLYAAVLKSPFLPTTIHLRNDQGEATKRNQHEAGYDSYITGVAFINIVRYLCAQELQQSHIPENLFDPANPLTAPYRNRPMPDRSHVFHITFPAEWRRENINALFGGAEVGGLQAITFLGDTTAYVTLKEPGAAKRVVEQFILRRSSSSLGAQLFKIQTYDDHVAKTTASGQEAKGKKTRLSTGDGAQSSAAATAKSAPPTSPPLQKVKKIRTEEKKETGDEKLNGSTTTTTTENGTTASAAAAAAVVIETDLVAIESASSSSTTANNNNSSFSSSGIVPLLKERLKKNTAATTTKANNNNNNNPKSSTNKTITTLKEEKSPDDDDDADVVDLFNVPAWVKNDL
ncbi:PREDICTED: poly(A)-specific ribonuclease PARN-like [Rhagoletis zephyria]|uniref:poly(A)-specific ribonuclease PARN-like n=1 Tax=Rhagoletis zephyria TaxID=28612 RepID=UPI0008119AFF|nr:PREDICTED: poly(A)-specific ribonuclease PARN-like [Rhagoletis zephyria]